jgi:hypothetical protein
MSSKPVLHSAQILHRHLRTQFPPPPCLAPHGVFASATRLRPLSLPPNELADPSLYHYDIFSKNIVVHHDGLRRAWQSRALPHVSLSQLVNASMYLTFFHVSYAARRRSVHKCSCSSPLTSPSSMPPHCSCSGRSRTGTMS